MSFSEVVDTWPMLRDYDTGKYNSNWTVAVLSITVSWSTTYLAEVKLTYNHMYIYIYINLYKNIDILIHTFPAMAHGQSYTPRRLCPEKIKKNIFVSLAYVLVPVLASLDPKAWDF